MSSQQAAPGPAAGEGAAGHMAWHRLPFPTPPARRSVVARTLAELRRGVGREPGTVPEMWPHYTQLTVDGRLSRRLRAEHLAVSLFGMHQQSHSQPMHQPGRSLGRALREFHQVTRETSPGSDATADAVDKRLAALATATSFPELAEHLRGVVSLLGSEDISLDYDLLYVSLLRWQDPERRGREVRRWGADYFLKGPDEPDPAATQPAPTSSTRQTNPERG